MASHVKPEGASPRGPAHSRGAAPPRAHAAEPHPAKPANPHAPDSHGGPLSEHHRHGAHRTHTTVDAARLAREVPHLAGEVTAFVATHPALDTRIGRAIAEIGKDAPDLARRLLVFATEHPKLGKPFIQALPRIQATLAGVTGQLAREFPMLSRASLARIAEHSVTRGIGKAIPVAGVAIAAWGTLDTGKAFLDARLSPETRARYAAANCMDWGAAVGGLLAETGVGEVAAISAAVASISLYARAEASKERDLAEHGHAPAHHD